MRERQYANANAQTNAAGQDENADFRTEVLEIASSESGTFSKVKQDLPTAFAPDGPKEQHFLRTFLHQLPKREPIGRTSADQVSLLIRAAFCFKRSVPSLRLF